MHFSFLWPLYHWNGSFLCQEPPPHTRIYTRKHSILLPGKLLLMFKACLKRHVLCSSSSITAIPQMLNLFHIFSPYIFSIYSITTHATLISVKKKIHLAKHYASGEGYIDKQHHLSCYYLRTYFGGGVSRQATQRYAPVAYWLFWIKATAGSGWKAIENNNNTLTLFFPPESRK